MGGLLEKVYRVHIFGNWIIFFWKIEQTTCVFIKFFFLGVVWFWGCTSIRMTFQYVKQLNFITQRVTYRIIYNTYILTFHIHTLYHLYSTLHIHVHSANSNQTTLLEIGIYEVINAHNFVTVCVEEHISPFFGGKSSTSFPPTAFDSNTYWINGRKGWHIRIYANTPIHFHSEYFSVYGQYICWFLAVHTLYSMHHIYKWIRWIYRCVW